MGCLYRLISPSGKMYIGITMRTFEERWQSHLVQARHGRQHALQNAFNMHGAGNFKREVLVISDDKEYLIDLECRAIKEYATLSPHGYNLTTGGEGIRGITQFSKDKRSAALRAKWAETKSKRLGALETMRAALRVKMEDPVAENSRRQKIAQTMSATSSTDAAKKRLGSIGSIVWNDPVRRAALLAKRQAVIDSSPKRERSAEQCAKHSETMKKVMGSPEMRAHLSAKTKAHYEAKKKQKDQG